MYSIYDALYSKLALKTYPRQQKRAQGFICYNKILRETAHFVVVHVQRGTYPLAPVQCGMTNQ